MREAPARFSNVTSRMKAPKMKKTYDYAPELAGALFPEMRKNSFTKKLGLTETLVSLNLKHHVRAASCTIFFDPLDALFAGPGNGANFMHDIISDIPGCRCASAFFPRF